MTNNNNNKLTFKKTHS